MKAIVDIFKEVADAYTEVNEFTYGKVWDMNGKMSRLYPTILVESQPDWTSKDARPNFKTVKKEYKFKVFAFDLYQQGEMEQKNLWTKQHELEVKFERYLAEVWRKLMDAGYFVGKDRNGFHGYFESHNDKLIEVYEQLTITCPVDCDLGTFVYPEPVV